jgi:hypothetical protein
MRIIVYSHSSGESCGTNVQTIHIFYYDYIQSLIATLQTILDQNMMKITENAVAKFIVTDWVDKVDSGIGLAYWPARLQ